MSKRLKVRLQYPHWGSEDRVRKEGAKKLLLHWYGPRLFEAQEPDDEEGSRVELLYVYDSGFAFASTTIAIVGRSGPDQIPSIEVARLFPINGEWQISIDQILHIEEEEEDE